MPQQEAESPAKLALPLLPHVVFLNLHMTSGSFTRTKEFDERGGKLNVPLSPSQSLEVIWDQGKSVMLAVVSLRLTASENEATLVKLEAVYRLAYKINPTFTGDRVEERVKAFCESYSIAHAWPYWREFISSVSGRMGLP